LNGAEEKVDAEVLEEVKRGEVLKKKLKEAREKNNAKGE